MGFLTSILAALDPIGKIADRIAQYKIEAAKAATDREKVAADERVKTLEAQRDVLIAEASSGSRTNQYIRVLLSLPAIVFLWKVIVWDKVLKLGSTDDLSQNLWTYVLAVVGFYLLNRLVQVAKR